MNIPQIAHEHIEMVPIEQIRVLNPRARNKRHHRDIIENIRVVGLKRPITISRRKSVDGIHKYDLVCGQGRLEAFQQLNQTEIPAFVVDATEEDCLVMSLVENIARRSHRPIDLMKEIGQLRERGYTDVQIGEKIGVTASWVNMIGTLLTKGEERLLTAVEKGLIPLSMATVIARSSEGELQNLLAVAYEDGMRGKKLSTLRRLLELREKRQTVGNPPMGGKVKRAKLTAADLRRIYEREAEKQRLMVKKAEFTHDRLVFATEALKELFENSSFSQLLRSEGLDTVPALIRNRIAEGSHP